MSGGLPTRASDMVSRSAVSVHGRAAPAPPARRRHLYIDRQPGRPGRGTWLYRISNARLKYGKRKCRFGQKVVLTVEISDLHLTHLPIDPPLPGGLKHATKVMALYVTENGERRKIDHNFGEMWGRTQEEADAKMTASVNKWIAENS